MLIVQIEMVNDDVSQRRDERWLGAHGRCALEMRDARCPSRFSEVNVELVQGLEVVGHEAHRYDQQVLDATRTESMHRGGGFWRQPTGRTNPTLKREVRLKNSGQCLEDGRDGAAGLLGVGISGSNELLWQTVRGEEKVEVRLL